MVEDLNVKETKGLIKIAKAIPYEGTMVYVRQIKVEEGFIFEWLFHFEDQLYSSYVLITSDDDELTDKQIQSVTALLTSGAEASIDSLMGKEPNEEAKKIAEQIDSVARKEKN